MASSDQLVMLCNISKHEIRVQGTAFDLVAADERIISRRVRATLEPASDVGIQSRRRDIQGGSIAPPWS